MSRSSNSPATLSYHLALYLVLLGRASQGSCYARLNLATLVCTTARALNRSEQAEALLASSAAALDELRASYEPRLDYDEYATDKKSAFDTLLYIQIGKIERVIDEYTLIQRSVIQDVFASSWNDKGVKR